MRENHEEKTKMVKEEFESINQFMAWKEEIEKKTTSWYVKYRGTRKGKRLT